MARFSIGRALQYFLVGATLVLAVIAVLGIVSLESSRQSYENRLQAIDALQLANAEVLAAGTDLRAEQLLTTSGRAGAAALAGAQRSFAQTAARARALSGIDGRSADIVARELAAEQAGALLAGHRDGVALGARAQQLRAAAHHTVTGETRGAVIVIAASGAVALAAVLVLLAGIAGALRAPLEQLVGASERLASGELDARVRPGGPRELATLGDTFNRMGSQLQAAQDRLEQERALLAVTIDSLGDALVIADRDGRVLAANPRARELAPELSAGERIDSAAAWLPALGEALADEIIVARAPRTLAVTAARMPAERGGAIWTLRDITERARLEQAKSDFVATASHELRSPLTSIKGYAELLAATTGLDARQRKFVDVIALSSTRLNGLVDDLLEVAKLDADHVELRLERLDLCATVREVADLLHPRLDAKGQELVLELTEEAPLADADPGRIRQIITNLMTNAHLYTDAGGRIAVRVGFDQGAVRVEVADNGRGMSAEVQERIFERFYRAGGRSGEPGTGLGLPIARSLAELHGGTLTVASEPGAGSTFTLRLPRVALLAPEPAAASDGPATARALAGTRILIVDDQREIAELIVSLLGEHGVTGEVAASAREALERLHSERFDAVTLDVLMPEMSGLEALGAIRADEQLARLPVVFVTVFSRRPELAGERVVPKPIDADALVAALRGAIAAGDTGVLVLADEEDRASVAAELQRAGVRHEWAGG
jgi:signal transduction histidine kinase/ActR/RegA family two-component response regulator/HAMP domain-containing protein